MSDKNARSLRSESSAVSLNLELSNLEHALRGASLLAELLANHDLPDEEMQRMAPHCITAQLALVNARLRHVGRVIRGDKFAGTFSKDEVRAGLKGGSGLDARTFSMAWEGLLRAGDIVPVAEGSDRYRIHEGGQP